MRQWLRIALCFAVVAPVHAQSIRGRVTTTDGVTPAPGILLLAVDGSGHTVARALSSQNGAYYLALPSASTVTVRAIRIGWKPQTIPRVVVGNGDVTLDLRIDRAPVELAAMRVLGGDDCLPDGDDARRFLELIEQARNALAVEHLAERALPTEYRMIRMRGVVDRKGNRDDVDSTRFEELLLDRQPGLTSVDSLLKAGYVRFDPDGRVIYDVPNPDLLMSDDFLASHCFRLVKGPREYRLMSGVAFWPAMVSDSMADIDGTIWTDLASGELRRIDFGYMNLPELRATICQSPKQGTPSFRFCTDRYSLALATGGYLTFRRMDSGEWLVNEMVVRAPSQRDPRDTTNRPITSTNLQTTHVTVSSVKQAGQTVYSDPGLGPILARYATRRAGRHPGALDGTVVDSTGYPVANAVVQVVDPLRVAITDSVGHFHFSPLPADTVTIQVRAPAHQAVFGRVALMPDSTQRLTFRIGKP